MRDVPPFQGLIPGLIKSKPFHRRFSLNASGSAWSTGTTWRERRCRRARRGWEKREAHTNVLSRYYLFIFLVYFFACDI